MEGPLVPNEGDCQEVISQFGGVQEQGGSGVVYELHVSPLKVRLSRSSTSGSRPGHGKYPSRGLIKTISRKSRNQMVKTFAERDFTPMFTPGSRRALVTLTYPGDWKTVAPTGKASATHRESFLRRLQRDWGDVLALFWVREVTSRGAPHFHIYMQVPEGLSGQPARQGYKERMAKWETGERPTRPRWRQPLAYGLPFSEWAQVVWAEIVNHPNPIEQMKHKEHGAQVDYLDGSENNELPRMMAYFSKSLTSPYSTKGHQLQVPELWRESEESIGRNWGHRGLKKAVATIQISEREFTELSRLQRRKSRYVKLWDHELQESTSKPALRTQWRPRGRIIGFETDPHGVKQSIRKKRKTTIRRKAMSGNRGAGYSLTDNGPHLANSLYRFLLDKTRPATPVDRLPSGMRGPVTERLKKATPPSLKSYQEPTDSDHWEEVRAGMIAPGNP